MTRPPVTMEEFRGFLNIADSDTKDDVERWGKLLAATEMVEARVGAMEPRTITSRVVGYDVLVLPEGPVMHVSSVSDIIAETAVTLPTDAVDVAAGIVALHSYRDTRSWQCDRSYTVTYMVGRDPVPDKLREATMIVAEQLWQSQRGPVGKTRTGADERLVRGFAWPNRALELIAQDDLPVFS